MMKLSHIAFLSLIGVGLVLADPGLARPGNGQGRGNRPVEVTPTSSTPAPVTDTILTSEVSSTLVDIIYGHGDYEDLISEELRLAIISDLNSLPPGIQRQLARGRSLPPGIAKQYYLPPSVLPVLGLDPETTLLVIGRDVLVVNPQDVVIDLVEDLL